MRTSVSSTGIQQESRPQPITLRYSKHRYALISVHGDPAAEIGRDGAGGQNVYVRSLGVALAEQGHQVDMFTRREHPDQPSIVQHSSGCRTIRLDAGPAEFIHRDYLFEYLPTFIESWLAFQQESGCQYEIVHSNYWLSGWVGMQLSARLGIPQVHTYHSIGKIKYETMGDLPEIAPTRLATERACLEKADCVISTSPQEAADLRQLVSDRGRIEIIPCGIDTNRFSQYSKATARELLGIPSDTRLLLYVGRFDRRKGIETLLEACARLPKDFQLYLVGGSRGSGEDGIEYDRIQALVESLRLTDVVTFKGKIPQPQLPPYYAAADACIVPSYYEPFGLVAIEAMAAGTPVIASKVGGLQYSIADGETGLLVPPQEPDALASAISSVLNDRSRSSAMGKAGAARVESQFSCAAVAAKINKLYGSLLQSLKN
jgi:D-inositol-3-phosphate glycosyltransferase